MYFTKLIATFAVAHAVVANGLPTISDSVPSTLVTSTRNADAVLGDAPNATYSTSYVTVNINGVIVTKAAAVVESPATITSVIANLNARPTVTFQRIHVTDNVGQ